MKCREQLGETATSRSGNSCSDSATNSIPMASKLACLICWFDCARLMTVSSFDSSQTSSIACPAGSIRYSAAPPHSCSYFAAPASAGSLMLTAGMILSAGRARTGSTSLRRPSLKLAAWLQRQSDNLHLLLSSQKVGSDSPRYSFGPLLITWHSLASATRAN